MNRRKFIGLIGISSLAALTPWLGDKSPAIAPEITPALELIPPAAINPDLPHDYFIEEYIRPAMLQLGAEMDRRIAAAHVA